MGGAVKSIRMTHAEPMDEGMEPPGVPVLDFCQQPRLRRKSRQQRGAEEKRLFGDADRANAVAIEQLGQHGRHGRQHFDVLMAVQVRRLQTALEREFDLPRQFISHFRQRGRIAPPQAGKEGKNAGKTALAIQEFAGIFLAREGTALSQIQMHAEIEGQGGIMQTAAELLRGNHPGGKIGREPLPKR